MQVLLLVAVAAVVVAAVAQLSVESSSGNLLRNGTWQHSWWGFNPTKISAAIYFVALRALLRAREELA